MDENALLFFQQDIEALPLYERLEGLILDRIADVQIKVQKSQISFYNRHMFACVSFSKVRKAKDRPAHYIVVTFGLQHCLESPRIDVATEPYPNRWTHHVLVTREEEIDGELLAWLAEAYQFAQAK